MDLAFPHAGEVYSFGCALTWAVAVILFRRAGDLASPVALNVFKGVVAMPLFLATMAAAGIPFLPEGIGAGDSLVLLASGALGIGIADTIFFASLNRLGATGSAVVDCAYSPFVVLCSVLYLGEPVGPAVLAGVGFMVAAVLLLAGEHRPRQGGKAVGAVAGLAVSRHRGAAVPPSGWGVAAGVALGLLSMFLMAAGIVLAKPVLARTHPVWATAVRFAGGLLLLGGQVALRPEDRRETLLLLRPGRAWLVVLPGAVVGTYVSVVLWTAGMKFTRASVASVLNQTSTLLVPLLAAVFLGERPGPRTVAAIALGVAATLAVVA